MTRGRQTKGPAQYSPHRARHDIGHTDASTAARDAAKLGELKKALKPPHRHVYVGGKCKVCELPEVEST